MSRTCPFCKRAVVSIELGGIDGDIKAEGMFIKIGPFDTFVCFDCYLKRGAQIEGLKEWMEEAGITTLEELANSLRGARF